LLLIGSRPRSNIVKAERIERRRQWGRGGIPKKECAMQAFRKPLAAFGRVGMIAVVAVAVFAGGLGIGAGLSSTGAQTSDEIQGCVNRFTGALRVVTGPGQCSSGERALSWNQIGPSGILDVQTVTASEVIFTEDETDSVTVRADCPTGYTVVGGGAGLGTASGGDRWFVSRSTPVKAGTGMLVNDGWRAILKTIDGDDAVGQYIFDAQAVCVHTS
jgi:hypothetical protein